MILRKYTSAAAGISAILKAPLWAASISSSATESLSCPRLAWPLACESFFAPDDGRRTKKIRHNGRDPKERERARKKQTHEKPRARSPSRSGLINSYLSRPRGDFNSIPRPLCASCMPITRVFLRPADVFAGSPLLAINRDDYRGARARARPSVCTLSGPNDRIIFPFAALGAGCRRAVHARGPLYVSPRAYESSFLLAASGMHYREDDW